MTETNVAHLPRIGIGEAARLYGMTLRAIRFYEEHGLVQARRDRNNNRYFDGAARRRLEWIGLLRHGGLSLDDIGEVLQAEDRDRRGRDCALAKLQARRREVEIELTLVELGNDDASPRAACARGAAPRRQRTALPVSRLTRSSHA